MEHNSINFNNFLAKYLNKKYNQESKILDSTNLSDLGIDSLDIIDIIGELEILAIQKIDFDNFKFSNIKTVGELKNEIQKQIKIE